MMKKQPKPRRVSLTKAQRLAGAGAELLALCQSITEDGSISKPEIHGLVQWLNQNRGSDLPAVEFLTVTVKKIIADRKVTHDELKELYKALEKVLPPEVRKDAVENRRVVEQIQRERIRVAREAEKERRREERERDRPEATANFMVAGVRHEGRPQVIEQFVDEGSRAFLVRDRGNEYSRNAIEVRLENGLQIGFVPENDAVKLAPFLDQPCSHDAFVTKVLTAGRSPIPVVQAYVYRPDAENELAVFEKDVPVRRFQSIAGKNAPGSSGCLLIVLLGILGVLLLAAQ